MINIKELRTNTKTVTAALHKKDPDFDAGHLLELDEAVRARKSELEELRSKRNNLAKQGADGVSQEIRQQSIELGKKIKSVEQNLENVQQEFDQLLLSCPNIPDEEVPAGDKEDNQVIHTWRDKPSFSFPVKNHIELNETLNWFNLDAASYMSGSHFVWYEEPATKLIYALTQLMLRINRKHGFTPVLPPYLVRDHALVNAGNFPKFTDDVYTITKDDLFLIPTAEVALTNRYAKQILDEKDLPIRHASWTSCFRREAGSYGAQERGLIRIHQFEKVELYSLCTPQQSEAELNYMLTCAQEIVETLGLHYRISLLAAQDTSFQSAKTYDIEVWLPGQERYYEVSSASTCRDFQARRAQIRYRADGEKKPHLVHTLNASSLALPRLIVALMETYQQPDGSIRLPDILEAEMNRMW